MENVLLVTMARQMSLRQELDVIANNVANVNTNGFKRRLSEVNSVPVPVASDDRFRAGKDRKISFPNNFSTPLDLSVGQMEPTGNPLDVAVSGDSWLVVSTPQGERYTRNGAFMLDSKGRLVTSDGYPLVGEQGAFQFGATETNIAIGSDGIVSSSNGTRGRLKLVRFSQPEALKSEGSNLFSSNTAPEKSKDPRVQSGFLERSNVKPVLEMSRMIEISRQYQNIANIITKTDEVRRNAVQRLGEPI